MIDEYNNIFYINNINSVGGIESWIYYTVKLCSKTNNIALVYNKGDVKQIVRLKKYIKCIKYNREKIKCDNAIFCYDTHIIDNIEAKEYIQFIHGDYEKVAKNNGLRYTKHPKITKVYAVSKLARDSLKKAFNIDSEVIYNPVEIDKPRSLLKLISATRLAEEKGLDNMVKLGDILDANNIPYIWYVFTDKPKKTSIKNMVMLPPSLDITSYIADSHYLVQLSKWESSGYSPEEALLLGKKLIITDIPAFREIGANENNSYFFNGNIDIKQIYEDRNRVIEYTPPESEIQKVLVKSKPIYEWRDNMKYKVKAIIDFNDLAEKKQRVRGDEFIVNEERYCYLSGNNPKGIIAVQLIEEIVEKKDKVEENKEEIVKEEKPKTTKKSKKK